MSDAEKIRKMVDEFYFGILDDYKLVTEKIREESSFTGIFKKKKYDKHIRKLTELRKRTAKLDPESVESSDPVINEVQKLLEKSKASFYKLAGAQLDMQAKLKDKANGDKRVKMSDLKVYQKIINETTQDMNKDLKKLDLKWADFLEVYG